MARRTAATLFAKKPTENLREIPQIAEEKAFFAGRVLAKLLFCATKPIRKGWRFCKNEAKTGTTPLDGVGKTNPMAERGVARQGRVVRVGSAKYSILDLLGPLGHPCG